MTHRRNMVRGWISAAGLASLLALIGCGVESSLTPMRPIERDVYWMLVDDPAATAPAETAPSTTASTEPATATATNPMPATATAGSPTTAPTTAPTEAVATASAPAETLPASTLPAPPRIPEAPKIFRGDAAPPAPAGKKYVRMERVVDPNQTTRFAYRVNYDYLWNHTIQTVADFGYTVDRRDYRLGVIISKPRFSGHVVEPWRQDHSTATAAMENTMHSQRRTIRVTISKALNPAFYEVSVQVLVDREVNTPETLSGALAFRDTGSGFGRHGRTLQSDHIGITDIPADAAAATQPASTRPTQPPQWHLVGRDSVLEGKVLEKLFDGL